MRPPITMKFQVWPSVKMFAHPWFKSFVGQMLDRQQPQKPNTYEFIVWVWNACLRTRAVSSLCPVYFSSPATLHLPSTTLVIPSQPTHTGRESVDQWSRVPTGTVVEQIASTAAVVNATRVKVYLKFKTEQLTFFSWWLSFIGQSVTVKLPGHTWI